ncbi:hypothetical protein T458_09420 [Brevibacillus panacihumi W25]|uniref:Uncharacterized protein n=1 Tax=Brevibacillus panacihumi W25 TaxID=1408254 RepID=V6MB29_9BACL|nr:hypothetical protein T458_09420 [Brevibacillus panacihumi W25]
MNHVLPFLLFSAGLQDNGFCYNGSIIKKVVRPLLMVNMDKRFFHTERNDKKKNTKWSGFDV